MNYFKKLEGLKIIIATYIHDYIQLGFDNEAGMNINNKYVYSKECLGKLIGLSITKIIENKKEIKIILDDESILSIDLSEDSWNGPEALEISLPGEPLMVINETPE